MLPLDHLVASLGGGLLRLVAPGPASAAVADVVIAEPGDSARDLSGDLVFGAGVADATTATELVRRSAQADAAGVVLRGRLARGRGVCRAARQHGVALLELDDNASLVHVLGLLGGILDSAAAPGVDRADAGVQGDLLALADAAAGLVDAPVTIEDAQSRVLAYSSQHGVVDTARVSTIVGRRVPADVVAHMRSRGVFRRLARSDEPFLVPPGPGQERPRFVVPVRAGGEWLGSIWAVVDAPPRAQVVQELRRAATVVALHLLRLRAQADLTRRVTAERLRALLAGGASSSSAASWLPEGPWRVVALSRGGPRKSGSEVDGSQAVGSQAVGSEIFEEAMSSDIDSGLDLWESRCRRAGWRQPLLTDLDGQAYAVVQARPELSPFGHPSGRPRRPAAPGTWTWLVHEVQGEVARTHGGTSAGPDEERPQEQRLWVCAGRAVSAAVDLVRSRAEAADLVALRRAAGLSGRVLTAETEWAGLATARAVDALGEPAWFAGPVAALRQHDEQKHTAYLPSLAAWLDHPGEPTAAARALGVHVNTLRYRMVRMSELAPLPLDDPASRLAMGLQLLALGS